MYFTCGFKQEPSRQKSQEHRRNGKEGSSQQLGREETGEIILWVGSAYEYLGGLLVIHWDILNDHKQLKTKRIYCLTVSVA